MSDKERTNSLTTTITALQSKTVPAGDYQQARDIGIAARQANDEILQLSGKLKAVVFK